VYAGAGGGFGLIDSQGVEGGQGQDFTLNWFGHLGLQRVINDSLTLRVGTMFQHMSNGGATSPNPGIDAVGFTVGASWKF
jgi:long-subunit fatty acid transport protein